MADLSSIQGTEATRIVGSDATGIEQTPVKSTANGDLGVADIMDASGVQGAITVGTSAVAARVGGSNLSNRKNLSIWNNGNATIYWGYTNAVTTVTGTPLMRNQQLIGDWGPNTTIYLISGSAGQDVRITEGA
jgi:hypothetical protein